MHKCIKVSDKEEDTSRYYPCNDHGHVVHKPQHSARKFDFKQPIQIHRDQRDKQIHRQHKQQGIINHSVDDSERKQIIHKMCATTGEALNAYGSPHAGSICLKHISAEILTYYRHGDAKRIYNDNQYFQYSFIILFKKLLHSLNAPPTAELPRKRQNRVNC